MTDTTALKALLAKVEAGKALQHDLRDALDTPCQDLSMQAAWMDAWLAYKGDLNAAKALHEAVLPGWGWTLESDGLATVWRSEECCLDWMQATNLIPARALLAADLKALIAEGEDQ